MVAGRSGGADGGGHVSEARARWDAKHAARGDEPPRAPDAFFERALAELRRRGRLGPGTRAVDLAAGGGRHALALLAAGCEVEAWDVSPVALERLAARAAEAGHAARLRTRAVDLERAARDGSLDLERAAREGSLGPEPPFDLAALVDFLDRPLLERLAALVRPGGHLVFTTFTVDREGDHPSARWCLARGELAAGVPGFRTLLHEERGGRAGILAERASAEDAAEGSGT